MVKSCGWPHQLNSVLRVTFICPTLYIHLSSLISLALDSHSYSGECRINQSEYRKLACRVFLNLRSWYTQYFL